MSLRETIENYNPLDEQEERDKEQMLMFIDNFDDVLTRNNLIGHFSASAFVVNEDKNKMAAIYHIINDGWAYPGGHADGEENLLEVAHREVLEETGLKAKILDPSPRLLSTNAVPPHIKRGLFIPSHLHFDLVYLMQADDTIPLEYRMDESKGVKWIPFDEIETENMVGFIRPLALKMTNRLWG